MRGRRVAVRLGHQCISASVLASVHQCISASSVPWWWMEVVVGHAHVQPKEGRREVRRLVRPVCEALEPRLTRSHHTPGNLLHRALLDLWCSAPFAEGDNLRNALPLSTDPWPHQGQEIVRYGSALCCRLRARTLFWVKVSWQKFTCFYYYSWE